MPIYRAPVDDMKFLLHDVWKMADYADLDGFDQTDPELINAVLLEGAKVAEEVLQPLNMVGDSQGCTHHEDGSVTTPDGFREAYKTYREGGWMGLAMPEELGGQNLPYVLKSCVDEMFFSANLAFDMYAGLTQGAIAAIIQDGTDEQKATYLPKMIEGRWTGTMNLTESHCGTDLGLLRTKAEPTGDGAYAITGTKIFISAGEHDLTDNIIHLVLARLPDAPRGSKGISLFIVPKFLVNADGTLGERNGVSCGSLEEKMGIHGNATAVLNYDAATGYLIGEPHLGLKTMFVMMNAARLGVAMQGLAMSEVSYQNAADYARDRVQGRALKDRKNPDAAADPIIVHPDVRRMLLDAKSFNEAGRALALWTALQIDVARRSPDAAACEQAEDVISLMTPVIKGVFTDRGYDNATAAQQVFGGHGYIQESGMDQFVRDVRICQIYEGTNGIQALDLVGRKLGANGGRAVRTYFGLIGGALKTHGDTAALADFTGPLKTASDQLQQATMWLMQNGLANPDNAGAGATAYMHLMGLVALGHMWLEMAAVSVEALATGTGNPDFHENKIKTGRYFMRRVLPEGLSLLAKIEAGAEDLMALDADAF